MAADVSIFSDGVLTVDQAATFLGVGKVTLYGLMNAGQIQFCTVGEQRRIPKRSLTSYLAASLRTGNPEDSDAVSAFSSWVNAVDAKDKAGQLAAEQQLKTFGVVCGESRAIRAKKFNRTVIGTFRELLTARASKNFHNQKKFSRKLGMGGIKVEISNAG